MPTHPSPSALQFFLASAKQATYAAQGDEASVAPLLPGAKQLEYSDGDLFYRDSYVGMLRFAGQEIVYLSERAVWSMSYAGGLCAGTEATMTGSIYAFLREALRSIPPELPLRGPQLLDKGVLRYTCQCSGILEQFHGTETIMQGEQILYQLHFSGGGLA